MPTDIPPLIQPPMILRFAQPRCPCCDAPADGIDESCAVVRTLRYDPASGSHVATEDMVYSESARVRDEHGNVRLTCPSHHPSWWTSIHRGATARVGLIVLAAALLFAAVASASSPPTTGLHTFAGVVRTDTCAAFDASLILPITIDAVDERTVRGRIGRLDQLGSGFVTQGGRWVLRVDAGDEATGCAIIAFLAARGRRAQIHVLALCAGGDICEMVARGRLTSGWTAPMAAKQLDGPREVLP